MFLESANICLSVNTSEQFSYVKYGTAAIPIRLPKKTIR